MDIELKSEINLIKRRFEALIELLEKMTKARFVFENIEYVDEYKKPKIRVIKQKDGSARISNKN